VLHLICAIRLHFASTRRVFCQNLPFTLAGAAPGGGGGGLILYRNWIAVTVWAVLPTSMSSESVLSRGGTPSFHQPIDRLGALASCACAVHCVLSSIVPEALAAVGLGSLLGHETEWGFMLAALVFAGAALVIGWRKHRSRPVVALLGGGIIALLLARLLEGAGELACVSLSTTAGALLVAGHVANVHASRRLRA
jgi:MerC mercury resistance protein